MINTLTMVMLDYLSQVLFQIVLYSGVLCLIKQADVTSFKGILFLILFSILATLVRRYSDKLWKFLVTTLMLGLVGMVLNQILLGDVVLTCLIVFICFFGYIIRIKKSAKDFEHPEVLPFVIMAIIYIIMEFIAYTHASKIAFISIFCYILLFLFYRNYERFIRYIESKKNTTIMAEGKMKKVFSRHITIYLIGLAFVILLLSTISFQDLYQSIRNRFSNINEIEFEPNQVDVQGQDPTSDNMKELIEMGGESNGPSIIWIVVEKIMRIALCILIAIVAGTLVYVIIRGIYYGFYGRKKKKEEEVLFASVETRERISKEKVSKKEPEKENDQRKLLRKIYRKHMSGFWRNTNCIPELTTPSEQRKLKNTNKEEIKEEVVQLYEVARYSNHNITKEDIVKMKNTLKK